MPQHRLVFFGSDTFSVPPLQAIADHSGRLDADLVGVVTQPDRPAGRGRRLTPNPARRLADDLGIPVLTPERLRERTAVEAVLSLRADLHIVAAYGQFLPATVLDTPRHRSLNIHPSLLPRHRGPSPVAATILAGDQITGVSLMLMTAQMDAGPIVAQVETPVREEDVAWELEARLSHLGAELLVARLPHWLEGHHEAVEQDESRASYSRKLTKADARLDWSLAAEMLARQVRAYNNWPIAFCYWGGRQVQILRASALPGSAEPGLVAELRDGMLLVGTGKDLLGIRELRLEGGRPMAAADLARGHPALKNAVLV